METVAQAHCQILVEVKVEEGPVQILEYKLTEVLVQQILGVGLVEVEALAARVDSKLPVSSRVVLQADLLDVLLCLGHGLLPTVVAWGNQLQEPEQQRLHHYLHSSSRRCSRHRYGYLNNSNDNHNNSDNYQHHWGMRSNNNKVGVVQALKADLAEVLEEIRVLLLGAVLVGALARAGGLMCLEEEMLEAPPQISEEVLAQI